MALNDPRTIPYKFRVFEYEHIAWLVDLSEHQFPCTATPHVYCEPLYYLDDDGRCEDVMPDAGLFTLDHMHALVLHELDWLDPGWTTAETDETDAWDVAREEANANHLI